MKLYCLHEGFYESVASRLQHLASACQKEGVIFCPLDSLVVDYSKLPTPDVGDILFNCARGSEALESLLLRPDVTTFYIRQPAFISAPVDPVDGTVVHHKANLPAPKTICSLTANRNLLAEYVQYLGGFPVILKARSGTRGVGTIKIESWPNLLSTVDYLVSLPSRFIMREFIPNSGTARLVVLGDQVIASEFRDNLPNDFRVSARDGEVNYYQRDFNKDCDELAIKATKLANIETAGVDVILDQRDEPYLLEVNFPHNFVPAQLVTGVDIARLMVRWLRDKSMKSFGP